MSSGGGSRICQLVDTIKAKGEVQNGCDALTNPKRLDGQRINWTARHFIGRAETHSFCQASS